MDKYKRLGKNTVLVFIGNAGSKLISLIMLPFYTRWLSVEDYGVTDLINVYVALLSGLATVGIVESVFVFPKGQPLEKQKAYFSTGLIFSFFLLALTALLFKIALAVFLYNEISNGFTNNAWLVYCLLISTFLQKYIQQFVRSIDKMKIYSVTGIVLTFATALFSFVMIPFYGIFGYIFALIFANLSATLYSLFCSGAFRYFSLRYFEKSSYAEMIKYSIPLLPNGVMWWLITSFNRPLMEYHLDLHAIGIFGIANKFSGVLLVVFSIFSIAWQNSVLEEFGKDDYGHFYNKMLRLIVSGLIFLFFILTISSKPIVSIFTTQDFYPAWQYIPILAFGVILFNIASLVGSNFSAVKQSKYFFYSALWVIVISIICNMLLIPKFGIMGASIAMPISFSIMALSRIIYSWKYVKIINIKHYIIMLVLGIAMIFTTLIIQNLAFKAVIAASIFIAFIIVNRELKDDVIKLYRIINFNKNGIK